EFHDCSLGMRATNLFNLFAQFQVLNNLTQHNKVLNHNGRILDLILCSEKIGLSDIFRCDIPFVTEDNHHPCLNFNLYADLTSDIPFQRNENDLKFNFFKADLEQLYIAVAEIDWTFLLDMHDPDRIVENFYDTLYRCFNEIVPKTSTSRQNKSYPVWFTRALIEKIKLKRKHWNQYRKNKSPYHLDMIKSLRREIRSDSRKEYSEFIKKTEYSLQNDPRKFWSFINQKKKTTSVPG